MNEERIFHDYAGDPLRGDNAVESYEMIRVIPAVLMTEEALHYRGDMLPGSVVVTRTRVQPQGR